MLDEGIMRMGCTLPASEKLGKRESSVPKMIFKNETGCKKGREVKVGRRK